MTSLLETRNLTKTYGGLVATQDVSLEIRSGEFHALIGPNGAGKTTLVAQLFGEIRPTRGSVWFDGADVTRRPMHARAAIGMTRSFQITTLAQELTVLENVLVGVAARSDHALHFWKAARHDHRLLPCAFAILDHMNLRKRADEHVAELSHGEQRLLELGIAVAEHPKLVLLDEPMAGLGPGESREMTMFLSALKGQVTVLMVEHDMEAVFSLADRISVMVRGRLVATGTPESIRNNAAVKDAYFGEDC